DVTFDVFWLRFMPVYQHSVAVVSLLLAFLSFYLMIKKTPEQRDFSSFQFAITLNDLLFGILFCPVVLFPTPAILCKGFVCANGLSDNLNMVISKCIVHNLFTRKLNLLLSQTMLCGVTQSD
ncbi:hypothetical protein PFISCL1PPCAC_14414, partial [Pristionchus fissidentatus]